MEVRWINDVYFKSAATDRSISVGCGYGNNDSVGYTNDKEITTAFQRAGNKYLIPKHMTIFLSILLFGVTTTPALCIAYMEDKHGR